MPYRGAYKEKSLHHDSCIFRNGMKLSMHSNAEEGLLLIGFDDEGREKLLGDIERTIAQQDHEFDILDTELSPDDPRGGNWKPNDFYNISWNSDENAPLHVDDSVYISGGKTALMDLYNRIRLLPADCKELELAAVHCETAKQKKQRLIGKLLLLLLLNAAIAFALLLGSLMHAIRHCEGRESPAFWHYIVTYVMFFAAISQPLWLLAEVLPANRLRKFCFNLSGLLLLPGLLIAAPVYLCDSDIIGIDSYALRVPLALLFLVAASCVFFYLRKRVRNNGIIERGSQLKIASRT